MLEKWAFQLILLGEDALRGLGIGTYVIGFVIAFIAYRTSRAEMQRAPYFALSALNYLVMGALGAMSLGIPHAMAGGYLWAVLSIQFLVTFVAGYAYGYISLARSRDAFASSRLAFLGLIPIANLWLLFSKSLNEPSGDRIPVIAPLRGAAGVTLGLALAIASAVVSAIVEVRYERLEESLASKPGYQQALVDRMLESRGVEATLSVFAENAGTPVMIDEVTTLKQILADGERMRRIFVITAPMQRLPMGFRRRIERNICTYPLFASLLRAGATIEEVYVRADGSAIGRQIVSQASCAGL